MRYQGRTWFTLIELVVVIAILGILSLWVYLPYSYHQQKTLLTLGAKELGLSLSEARNMALYGTVSWSGNIHIGLLIQDENTLVYNSYSLTDSWSVLSVEKTKQLPRGVTLTGSLVWVEYFFEAIEGTIYKRKESPSGGYDNLPLSTEKEIFEISYMNASNPNLQKTLEYYPKSFISEY